MLCLKRTGSYFCPNLGDLGQEHAGSSTAWAGREEEEAGSKMCDEVWTLRRGQSSNALNPKGLVSFSPMLASIQVGGKGVRKGDHLSLEVRARQGQESRASREPRESG